MISKISLDDIDPVLATAFNMARSDKAESIQNAELKQRRLNSRYYTIRDDFILDKVIFPFIQPETSAFSGMLRCYTTGFTRIVCVEEAFTDINDEGKRIISLLNVDQILTGGMSRKTDTELEALMIMDINYINPEVNIYISPYKLDKLDNIPIWQDDLLYRYTGKDILTAAQTRDTKGTDLAPRTIRSQESMIDDCIETIKMLHKADVNAFYADILASEPGQIFQENNSFIYQNALEKALGASLQCL